MQYNLTLIFRWNFSLPLYLYGTYHLLFEVCFYYVSLLCNNLNTEYDLELETSSKFVSSISKHINSTGTDLWNWISSLDTT